MPATRLEDRGLSELARLSADHQTAKHLLPRAIAIKVGGGLAFGLLVYLLPGGVAPTR